MTTTPSLTTQPSEQDFRIGSIPVGRFDYERAVRLPADENG